LIQGLRRFLYLKLYEDVLRWLMTKVLVSDPIDQAGIDILGQVAQVDNRPGLSGAELVGIIGEYDALMIRSGTQVTAW